MKPFSKVLPVLFTSLIVASCQSADSPRPPRAAYSYSDLGAIAAGSRAMSAILLSTRCSKRFEWKADMAEKAKKIDERFKATYIEYAENKRNYNKIIDEKGCDYIANRVSTGERFYDVSNVTDYVVIK